MNRCVWCSRWIWPWQDKSPGGVMHIRCYFYVQRIQSETQEQYWSRKQYDREQLRLRNEEEDRL